VEHVGGGGAQLRVADDEPLMTIATGTIVVFSLAEPVTVQSAVRLQVPDAV
jgi:hypothetical protein